MRKKLIRLAAMTVASAIMLTSCGGSGSSSNSANNSGDAAESTESKEPKTIFDKETTTIEIDGEITPLNIQTEENVIDDKYRNYYEIFVGSFYDSDGDTMKMGDLNGVIEKLDYINDGDPNTDTDLGCNGIWLMPICPSPSYHKYDVTDYMDIDEAYGTLDDYKKLVEECHKRGINIIIDLVMNHSSVAHPWFKEAKEYLQNLPEGKEPDPNECKYVEYYTFTKEQVSDKYYPVGSSDYYYYGEFSQQMPDLNLDNENVRKEFEEIAKFWLDLGTDGFRLDAAKEYFSGETDKNIEVLTWFNDYVKSVDEDAYIVAETWTSENADYVASGIDSAFDFLYSGVNGFIPLTVFNADTAYSGQFLEGCFETSEEDVKENNENGIVAAFIGNHDIDRITAILAYDAEQVKFAHGLLNIMNGSPFIYYGDEIGIGGMGADENKRSPMIWSSDEDAEGQTAGPVNMSKSSVINKFDSVEDQLADPDSILNYVKESIKIRNIFPEIARGEMTLLEDDVEDEEVIAMQKTYNGSSVIIIANCSSDEDKTITLSREKFGYTDIQGMLIVGDVEPAQSGDTIALPPRSIVILK